MTEELSSALPKQAQSWGLSRKLLNIFPRDALYNIYLNEYFGMDRCEELLEID